MNLTPPAQPAEDLGFQDTTELSVLQQSTSASAQQSTWSAFQAYKVHMQMWTMWAVMVGQKRQWNNMRAIKDQCLTVIWPHLVQDKWNGKLQVTGRSCQNVSAEY